MASDLVVRDGDPTLQGVYVAYVDDEFAPRHAGRELLYWDGARWSHRMSTQYYRGHVYGYIGPLPAMELVG